MRIGETEILVETTAVAGTEQASAVDALQGKAVDAFEQAKDAIVEVAKMTVGMIGRLPRSAVAQPSTVELEFALGFTVSGNVLLAGATANANLTVRLSYETAARPGAAPSDSAAVSEATAGEG